jgi:hypothetical protein
MRTGSLAYLSDFVYAKLSVPLLDAIITSDRTWVRRVMPTHISKYEAQVTESNNI